MNADEFISSPHPKGDNAVMLKNKTTTAQKPVQRRPRGTEVRVALSIPLDSSYGRQKLQGILSYMRKHPGWKVPMRNALPLLSWKELKRWNGDGIIGEFYSEDEISEIKKLGICVVDTGAGSERPQIPSVGIDDVAVGRNAAQHLVDAGLQNLLFFGQQSYFYSRSRYQGFANEGAARGVQVRVHWIEGPNRPDLLIKPGSYLSTLRGYDGPVGVFCASDRIAFGVLEACRKLSLSVPNRVAVLGCNNDEVLCQLSSPALSSIDISASTIGYKAAELLDQLMGGEDPISRRLLIPPAGLRVRASSDVLAVGDSDLANALRFIRDHAHEPIYVPDVMRTTQMSRRSLELLFKKGVGHGIYQEIRRTHIGRAQQLLCETELPIMEIALRSGFASLNRFEVAFQNLNACSASAYRRRHLSTTQESRLTFDISGEDT